MAIAVANASSLDYDVQVVGAPPWLTFPRVRLERESTTKLPGRLAAAAPRGSHAVRLQVQVANLQPSSGVPLEAEIEVRVTIE